MEFLKKLKPSLTSAVGLFLLPLCLLCSLFYLDLGALNTAFTSRAGATATWPSPSPPPPAAANRSASPEASRKVVSPVGGGGQSLVDCDFFDGKWVWDETYPLYESKDCKFMDDGFRCSENGRPDNLFTKWRWQPNHCHLPRFDAKLMLEKLRNRRLAFVGDSIGRNQWESLLCMLASAVPDKTSIYEVNSTPITKHMGSLVFVFSDYNCTIEYYRSPFLVVQGRAPIDNPAKVGMTVRVDQLDWNSWKWKDADVLIFNSGHWWNYEKTIRTGCYFQEGNEVKTNMSIQAAFQRSIETLLNWVENQVNTSKTHVFFRSYAPVHFSSGDWKTGGSCHQNKILDSNIPFTPKTSPQFATVNRVLSSSSGTSQASKVHLLNVTYMASQRRDGHPSMYYLRPKPAPRHRQDCSHWCLPGVPDTWNELLYASFLRFDSRHTNTSSKPSQSLPKCEP